MSSAKRDMAGRWTKASDEEHQTNDSSVVSKVERHKDTSIEKSTQPQAKDSYAHNDALRRDRKRGADIRHAEQTIMRARFPLLVCSWATASLCMLTKITFWIVFIFFIKSVADAGDVKALVKVLVRCWREPSEDSCSKLREVIFPLSTSNKSYQVSLTITDSALTFATALLEVRFPLLLRHPVILSLAMLSLFSTLCLLSYIHDVVVDVISVMDGALSDQALAEESGHPRHRSSPL